MDLDQNTPVGAVLSGSTMLNLCLCKIDIFRCSYFAGVRETK